jgi:hypothetical protein
MARGVVLRTRVEPITAAWVHVQAAQAQMSTSQWIAALVERELRRAGAADALSLSSYELAITLGYMLRSLMVDAMGADHAQAAVDEAVALGIDEASDALHRALEFM